MNILMTGYNEKLVSIIINTHNGEKYISKCINSIILQSYKNIEIIVWDNASNDSTSKIVNSFEDTRIKYFHSETFDNLYKARNKAATVATGYYITFLDTDDLILSNGISSRVSLLENSNSYACYSNLFICKNFKKKNIFYKTKRLSGKIYKNLLNNYDICFLTRMFKAEIFKSINFDPKYNIIGDFDFVIKLSREYDLVYCSEMVGIYNIYKTNLTNTNDKMHAKEIKGWFNEYYKTLLNNEKKLKRKIIIKYIMLKSLDFLKKKKKLEIFNYFLVKKKNLLFFILLKKYFDYLFLK